MAERELNGPQVGVSSGSPALLHYTAGYSTLEVQTKDTRKKALRTSSR